MTKTVSPKQAYEWLSCGEAVLIDVREADEFKAEHIAYGLSVPLSTMKSDFSQLVLPSGKKVIFHCLKGMRSEKACLSVQEMRDFNHSIFHIDGGIIAWKDEGLPVISKGQTKISIFRQVQMIVGALIALFVLIGMSGIAIGLTLAVLMSGALFFAGLTGWCGLAIFLSKMPWNK
ncbi:MAG: rhodanese-like domain-containing protein [Alphaproteobacteria bacterium]